MQINNDGSRDLGLTVWDLIPVGERLIVQNYPLNRGQIYGVPFLNQDGDGYNRIRWQIEDRNGNVEQGEAYSRDSDTVRVR